MALPLEWTRQVDGRYIKWEAGDVSLAGPWQVALKSPFEEEKPHTFLMPRLRDLAQSDDDKVKYHSGTATYTLTFKCEAQWLKKADRIVLDLGNVYNIADVEINGKQVAGGLWAPPFRTDVEDALVAGENSLTVKVTNAWHNRLLADRKLEPGRRRTWSTVYPDGKLRPAGLAGPVQLLRGSKRFYLPAVKCRPHIAVPGIEAILQTAVDNVSGEQARTAVYFEKLASDNALL